MMTRNFRLAAGCMAAIISTTSAAAATEGTTEDVTEVAATSDVGSVAAVATDTAVIEPAVATPAAPVTSIGPVPAAVTKLETAKAVRELDIMLMVSSLVCRHSAHDFQAEYRAFSARHLPELNAASRLMQAELVEQHGQKGAKRALDRISVRMANTFGQGHPTMDCSELKVATSELAARAPGEQLYITAVAMLKQPAQGPQPAQPALAIAVK